MPRLKVTNWEEFRLAFGRELKAEGPNGFEGLLARLFALETGQPFFLARSGDQPGGDVYGSLAGVAIQAKRYTAAKVDENRVEGDIDRTLREAPNTDVFVVAVTRPDNQLKLRLEKKGDEIGVDIVLLSLNDSLSPLGALCVKHWNTVREFLPSLAQESDVWAQKEAQTTNAVEALRQFEAEFTGLSTRVMVSNLAHSKLALRLRGNVLAQTYNHVNLTDGVPRERFRSALTAWWNDSSVGVGVIEGEEGMGKTWVAADFINELPGEYPVVIWLDSLAWCNTSKIEDIVRLGLESLLPPADKRIGRIFQKVFHRWNEPILIVLDGAMERGAEEATERLLSHYHQYGVQLPPKLRVLFTSRPMEHRYVRSQQFWAHSKVIQIGPFDDLEFAAAMGKFAPDVAIESLNQAITDLARIPRYLRLCLKLRNRVASLSHLNRQLLLWADLESKLDYNDPQWVGLQKKLGGTPGQILAHLAEQLGWPTPGGTEVVTVELSKLLPNFEQVRADLRDERIVINANPSHTKISTEHLVLGWALTLKKIAGSFTGQNLDSLLDQLHKALEPAASNDDKVRAVCVAALLEFLDDQTSSRLARVALLHLWLAHHNAHVTAESLAFFVNTDMDSYRECVEAFFRSYPSGSFEQTLIAPLVQLWKDESNASKLRPTLERWLRLIFPGDASGSWDRTQIPPPRFERAQSPQQLRLSYAAASIISFRPEFDVLPALADCYLSDSFCYGELGNQQHSAWLPIKSSAEVLGVLARWRYGESALPYLAEIAEGLSKKSLEYENLQEFVRLWRSAKLPEVFGVPKDIYGDSDPKDDAARMAYLYSALSNPSEQGRGLIGCNVIDRLAVRRDLEEFTTSQIDQLIVEANQRLDLAKHQNFSGSFEERGLKDLIPYLARYAREEFSKVVRSLWLAAIESADSWRRFYLLDNYLLVSDPDGTLVEQLISISERFKSQQDFEMAATRLTELMLFHANPEMLLSWLKITAELTFPGSSYPAISTLPLPTAFKELAPAGFDSIANHELEKCLIEAESTDPNSALQRACHWLQILAYITRGPSLELCSWALDLADRFPDCKALRFPILELVSRSSDFTTLKRALLHPLFQEYQIGYNAWRWGRDLTPSERSALNWEELRRSTTLTAAGWIIRFANRDDLLCEWGREFSAAALSALSPIPHSHSQVGIEIQTKCKGRVALMRPASLPGGQQAWAGISSPSWGIDRTLSVPLPTQAELDERNAIFAKDMEARRASDLREFTGFNAAGPLFRWSQIAPHEFGLWAEAYLAKNSDAGFQTGFEMAYLTNVVTIALLRIKPEYVLQSEMLHHEQSGVRVISYNGGVLNRVEALWEEDFNDSNAVDKERKQQLLLAANDEEILRHVLGAHVEGNSKALHNLAVEFLGSRKASERSLGVTLLAFSGDRELLSLLKEVSQIDESFWIRRHAHWACDACVSECSVKDCYSNILDTESFEDVIVGLTQLRPALSPMAFAWRSAGDNGSRLANQTSRNRAAIELFWAHWSNCSSSCENIEFADRKLKEFCRGERLKSGVTDRIAPWWQGVA